MSLRFTGVPRDNGSPCWSCDEVSWWDAAELRKDLPFRETAEDGYCDDYVVVSLAEARELHRRFADKAPDWEKDSVDELDRFLASDPPDTVYVVLWMYEWESGLD
jgi:hypothetical protein